MGDENRLSNLSRSHRNRLVNAEINRVFYLGEEPGLPNNTVPRPRPIAEIVGPGRNTTWQEDMGERENHAGLEDLNSDVNSDVHSDVNSDVHSDVNSDGENRGVISDEDEENEFDDNSCAQEDDNELSFTEKLANWALHVKHTHVDQLLLLLRTHECFQGLPKCARTLMNTPRRTIVVDIPPGKYTHFGMVKGISNALSTTPVVKYPHVVELLVNVDGLPLSRSSGSQFWPILASIYSKQVPRGIISKPFAIGVYHGQKKPDNVSDFLRPFIDEAKTVLREGVEVSGKLVRVEIRGFVCDAPARALIQGIKGHTAYYGCDKCIQRGGHIDNRVIFYDCNAALRTDEDFRMRLQPEHHISQEATALEELGIGMVSQFPFEYMHLVNLGVMRKFVTLLLRGPLTVRLSSQLVDRCSAHLLSIAPFVCREFVRKPRSLRDIDRWKATEWRMLLLYTGPVVFRDILPRHIYDNLLVLHFAISILISPNMVVQHNDYAKSLLHNFVKNFATIFHRRYLSYNVHGLLHLADDAMRFGDLDSFGAFVFENYLQTLKKLLRKHDRPLQQLSNRLIEQEENQSPQETRSRVTKKVDCLQLEQFVVYPRSVADSCVSMIDGSIVVVELIDAVGPLLRQTVQGRKFELLENLYTHPSNSSELGIYLASRLSHVQRWPASSISKKMFKIPLGSKFVVMPLRHCT